MPDENITCTCSYGRDSNGKEERRPNPTCPYHKGS